jgi:hypothetical protein
MTIHIDAARDHYAQAIGLYIFDVPECRYVEGVERPVSFAAEIKMEATTPGMYRNPSLRIPFESAQELMDALWNCNIRPTDQPDRSGEIAALKAHISDLQRMAFTDMG